MRKTRKPTDKDGSEAPPAERALRADARRNRARILAAAEQVFDAGGTAASTDDVARQAGVGIGTVFRHFPTKDALLQALALGRLQRLRDEALSLLADGDPATAFESFFLMVVREARAKRVYGDALADADAAMRSESAEMRAELRKAIGGLLERAQQAGAVRRDVGLTDVMALLAGVVHAGGIQPPHGVPSNKVTAVILDGLRPRRS